MFLSLNHKQRKKRITKITLVHFTVGAWCYVVLGWMLKRLYPIFTEKIELKLPVPKKNTEEKTNKLNKTSFKPTKYYGSIILIGPTITLIRSDNVTNSNKGRNNVWLMVVSWFSLVIS